MINEISLIDKKYISRVYLSYLTSVIRHTWISENNKMLNIDWEYHVCKSL